MFKKPKQGQVNLNLITGLVFGIAFLIIGTIIAFIVVSTLTEANLLTDGRTTTNVVNESITVTTAGTNLAAFSNVKIISCTVTEVNNVTDSIGSGNYSLTNSGCTIANTTGEYNNAWHVNYNYLLKGNEEYSSEEMSGGLVDGVDNVSSKIPTVLLIAAIILILGVLVLLVVAWQRMRIDGGSI